jgi:hypothetical protein
MDRSSHVVLGAPMLVLIALFVWVGAEQELHAARIKA